jgi:HSP20 family protein
MTSAFLRPAFGYNVPKEAVKESNYSQPASNISRKEGAYEIQLAVPGMSKDKIKIEVIDEKLIVTATKPENAETETGNFKSIRQEFNYEGFKRIFRLHKNANSAALSASFNQGILTIVIPDREAETIKIDIQ